MCPAIASAVRGLTSTDGLANEKLRASLGQTLTQSRHFMQPGSTTMPKSRTSWCTRTLEVHTAVQCPHPSHASETTIRPTDILSTGAKKPPYGHAYVQKPLLPRKYTTANPHTSRNGIATYHGGNVRQKSLTTK